MRAWGMAAEVCNCSKSFHLGTAVLWLPSIQAALLETASTIKAPFI